MFFMACSRPTEGDGMDNGTVIREMDLDQFVAAIPFHLDYLPTLQWSYSARHQP